MLKFDISSGSDHISKFVYKKEREIYGNSVKFVGLLDVEDESNSFLNVFSYDTTALPKYYAQLQTADARGLGLPAGRLARRHIDAAPKHSLSYFSSVSELMVKRIDVHLQMETLAFTDCDYC